MPTKHPTLTKHFSGHLVDRKKMDAQGWCNQGGKTAHVGVPAQKDFGSRVFRQCDRPILLSR